MLSSDRLLSRAIRRLGLDKRADYEPGDGYEALSETVLDLQERIQTSKKTFTVTTTVDTGSYTLPSDIGHVYRIQWPADWGQLTPRTQPQMAEFKASVESTYTLLDPMGEPRYFSMYRQAGTDKWVLEIEDGRYVDVGETITIYYSPIAYTAIAPKGEIDLPASMENLVKDGVTYRLAEMEQYYNQRLAVTAKEAYERGIIEWKSSQTVPMAMSFQADIQEF